MSAHRAAGYLRAAQSALRDGHPERVGPALNLARQELSEVPATAVEHALLAVAQAEQAQRVGDNTTAAERFADAVQLDEDAGRNDAAAVVRALRAALAADTAGDQGEALRLLGKALVLPLSTELKQQADLVKQRIDAPAPTPPQPVGPTVGAGAAATAAGEPPKAADELLEDLDRLVGLAEVKREVKELVALAQVAHARTDAGLPQGDRTRHLAMVGAPGTGKTTVARLLGKIYAALGVVGNGQLVEVTRADLVAGFVGQTATKTNQVVDSALGGVLFIDEAYSLVSGGAEDFGHEALAELVKRMEDDRGRLVVILAGYPDDMQRLIAANAGLRSRLQATLTFADYTPDELVKILDVVAQDDHWRLTDAARAAAATALRAMYEHRTKEWANARTVRSFFEECLAHQALRVTADGTVTGDDLDVVDAADVPD
jgi:hypothetical protein